MAGATLLRGNMLAGGTLPPDALAERDAYLHTADMAQQNMQASGAVPMGATPGTNPFNPVNLSHSFILWLMIILIGIVAYLFLKAPGQSVITPVQTRVVGLEQQITTRTGG